MKLAILSALATMLPGSAASERIPDGVAALSAGEEHTCAVTETGTAWCWGDNAFGQLGTGTKESSSSPVPVKNLTDVIAISAGGSGSCALTAVGKVWCWGDVDKPKVPLGSLVPVEVKGLKNVRSISAGAGFACAVTESGQGWCWGNNKYGQLGDGSTNSTNVPVRVKGLGDLISIGASNYYGWHTCGLQADGTVWCWGYADDGQLGTGTTDASSVPMRITEISDFKTLVAHGGSFGCALQSAGEPWCWGKNYRGQLGLGYGGQGSKSFLPDRVTKLTKVKSIVVGGTHTCAIDLVDKAWCWGDNGYEQLGNDVFSYSDEPVKVWDLPAITQIDAGAKHSCAVDMLGQAYCWGKNDKGQLGIGKISRREMLPAVVQFPAARMCTQARLTTKEHRSNPCLR